jgi:Fur family ferric uptake transcriptional regulator
MTVSTRTMRISGRRNTSQRKLLLDLIQQADRHMDARELYELARQHEPAINLSTVYRNLKVFKELGLVEERHLAEEHHHYEAKPAVEHHHLVCLGCGQVREFVSPLAKRMMKEVGRKNGFEISKTEIRMEGYCPQCRGEVSPK